jgi:hypothetical protein
MWYGWSEAFRIEKPNGCVQRINDKVVVGTLQSYEGEYGNGITGSVG